ncbi:hypothetical protein [Pseudomonas syringae]|uniref:hypothetical protein n=1 Tax=Pseudomonas syringae TaxID=317 RepID=UPI001BCD07B2|nr:hypothetical protein [Pseudomonas syringae]QVK31279.1 hypothetical protein KIJ28_19615 [Pseudomonas syringae]
MTTTIKPCAAPESSKTAVEINLVYVDDETQKMRIHAIVADGKLASSEMYCHLVEWNGEKNELQPGILTSEDDSLLKYEGEWGYGDKSDVRFEFLDRPLSIGQEVMRVDVLSGQRHVYTYRIVDITDLLK